jgi:hypothetical protein
MHPLVKLLGYLLITKGHYRVVKIYTVGIKYVRLHILSNKG